MAKGFQLQIVIEQSEIETRTFLAISIRNTWTENSKFLVYCQQPVSSCKGRIEWVNGFTTKLVWASMKMDIVYLCDCIVGV